MAENEAPIGALLKELRDETQALVRKEVELARVETAEKLQTAKHQLVLVGIGGVLLLAGLINLLAVLNRGLTSLLNQAMSVNIAVWLAPLIIAVALLAIGAMLAKSGIGTLRATSPRPERSIDEARRTKQWAARKAHTQRERMGG